MRRFKKLQAIFFIVLNALISVIKSPRIPACYPNWVGQIFFGFPISIYRLHHFIIKIKTNLNFAGKISIYRSRRLLDLDDD